MKITDIKLSIITSPMKIRSFCINHQYYTNGTVAQYENLLNFVDDNRYLQDFSLEWIARDIVQHSALALDEDEAMEQMKIDILNEVCWYEQEH